MLQLYTKQPVSLPKGLTDENRLAINWHPDELAITSGLSLHL
jgi:hypothetical protein